MAFEFRFLSICPRVSKVNGTLVATTAWRIRILTLGLLYRKLTVDPKEKVLTIFGHYFWFFPRQRRIKFSSIEALTYGYEDWSIGSVISWAHDSLDLFAVGIRLYKDEELHGFYFYGDGTFTNDGPLPDWLYWDDYLFDLSGTQERESKGFVDLVAKMVGVSVVPPRE